MPCCAPADPLATRDRRATNQVDDFLVPITAHPPVGHQLLDRQRLAGGRLRQAELRDAINEDSAPVHAQGRLPQAIRAFARVSCKGPVPRLEGQICQPRLGQAQLAAGERVLSSSKEGRRAGRRLFARGKS